ncbi:MAG: PAS domain S-box-containing protein [Phycisphaerales bacterium]|jgi:PAS domain S-box-containing protein
MSSKKFLTGKEQTFGAEEIIVSKTDLKGKITYANDVFLRVSGYTEAELLGKPHNIIRHPDMPRCVFELLWQTLKAGREIFAYVVNRCGNGDHYWVLAHVTPTFDAGGNTVGYHSNRRLPSREAIAMIKPIYDALLAEEKLHRTPKEQWRASLPILQAKLEGLGLTYEEFIFETCS